MEGLQHQADLTKDHSAFKELKSLSNLPLTFFAADFLQSSESDRAGMAEPLLSIAKTLM